VVDVIINNIHSAVVMHSKSIVMHGILVNTVFDQAMKLVVVVVGLDI